MAKSRRLDQPLLDRRVILHRPVTVEMIRREIEQQADARVERGREIDLEGRTFDDMDAGFATAAPGRGSACRYCRPSATSQPRLAQDMGDQRRGRALAIGAGDRDERRAPGAILCALAAEQFDVADDFDARRMGLCRASSAASGWVSGTPGVRISAAKADQSRARADRRDGIPPPRALSRAAGESSQAWTCAPPAASALRRGEAGAAEAEQGDRLAGKRGDRDHQRTFSVARPIRARTKAMIQNRTTTCGSAQPNCSK